jgi:Ni/Co efflux regulator RcnB
MQKRYQITACVAALVVVLGVAASPALAKKDKDDYPGPGWKQGGKGWKNDKIESSDRVIIQTYLADSYGKKCPPGLAKKRNGCLPPGQAKKYYPGDVLPAHVTWKPVPHALSVQLRPPPHGAAYVMVDRDFFLITEATRKILDAVTLLSAVQ